MEKEVLLQELSAKLASGEVTQQEVAERVGLSSFAQPAPATPLQEAGQHHFTVTKMLYVLGAAIVVIGIILFVVQIWDDMSSVLRIVITLGLGLMMAFSGSLLLKQKPDEHLGSVFHAIGGILIPLGAAVTIAEIDPPSGVLWYLSAMFSAIFAFYLILLTVHKKVVLTLFAIINGTTAIYLLTSAMLDPILSGREMEDVLQYLTMALGGSYLLLAHAFKTGWNSQLVRALHFFGIAGLLGAAWAQVFDSGVWELLYFIVVFGALFASVYMKSRIILIVSTFFLLLHVTYITSEYFADSLGWPIALVLLGFVFIGLGYTSIMINRKYIAT